MNHRNMAPYAIGAAAVAVILIAFGAPLGAVLVPLLILACPLMMFFMMKGMSGNDGHQDHTSAKDSKPHTNEHQHHHP